MSILTFHILYIQNLMAQVLFSPCILIASETRPANVMFSSDYESKGPYTPHTNPGKTVKGQVFTNHINTLCPHISNSKRSLYSKVL